MNQATIEITSNERKLYRILALIGLAGITIGFSLGNFVVALLFIIIPFAFILLKYVFDSPCVLVYVIFTMNYFIMATTRYVEFSGISVIMDTMFMLLLLIIFIHSALKQDIEWKYTVNTLSAMTFIWMVYCLVEVINPSGIFEAWFLSRNLVFSGFLITIVTSLVIVNFKQVKVIVILYSIFTLFAVLKALQQKFLGFDPFEQKWLNDGGALTHIILTGTRYFSFFTDAGNFGSNMGCASVFFFLLSLFTEKKNLKFYFVVVAALSGYGLFISGTRGAMIVPLGGLAMYILLSKNFKAFISGTVLLVAIYVFFAFTNIGQDNATIRRMRTSFTPSEDRSFIVRAENKKNLGEYLKNKPFGEGLGLGGVENKKFANRVTTEIPHDSWYVKLWMETGIVGLLLYITVLLSVVFHCAYIIMFKINNREAKGYYIAMLAGTFGLMLSAYGNAFFGQYPTLIMVFMFLSIIIKGETLEKTLISTSR